MGVNAPIQDLDRILVWKKDFITKPAFVNTFLFLHIIKETKLSQLPHWEPFILIIKVRLFYICIKLWLLCENQMSYLHFRQPVYIITINEAPHWVFTDKFYNLHTTCVILSCLFDYKKRNGTILTWTPAPNLSCDKKSDPFTQCSGDWPRCLTSVGFDLF